MTHTVLQICCRDRKGLLYDIMRTIKDNSLRVTYAKVLLLTLRGCCLIAGCCVSGVQAGGAVLFTTTDRRVRIWLSVWHSPTQVAVKPNNTCFADVFVQDAVHKSRVTDAYILHWLVEKIRTAVASPFTVSTKDVYDGLYTELKVVAPVDSGGRGRPKVRRALPHLSFSHLTTTTMTMMIHITWSEKAEMMMMMMMMGDLWAFGCRLMLVDCSSSVLPAWHPPLPLVMRLLILLCVCVLLHVPGHLRRHARPQHGARVRLHGGDPD